MRVTALLMLGLGLAACAADETDAGGAEATTKDSSAPVLGKGDQAFATLEVGPIDGTSATRTGVLDGSSVQAFRFYAYGNTRIRVTMTSPGLEVDSAVAIDGPLPTSAGQIVGWNDDDPSRDTLDSSIELTLEAPGAYRIMAGTYSTFRGEAEPGGAYELRYECLENCVMPQITLGQLIGGLVGELGRDQTIATIESAADALFPDPQTAAAVKVQVAALIDNPDLEGFPRVPLNLGDTVQGFFESETVAPPAPSKVEFDLGEILTSGCQAERSGLEPVDERIPGLMRGAYADYRLDDCSLQRAQDFADVMNNLALDNGSSITYEGERYETIADAVDALVASGHTIKITNDRFFADFLGLYYNGAAVMAPVWLETTIDDGDGGKLAIPSPHTHHTIVVEGPLVNTTLMYYMGVSAGTSFRAVSNLRAPWTGLRTYYRYDSNEDADTVKRILVIAGELRKKWVAESAGLPADGYGTLGVCNDSTAVLEWEAEGSASIFPLAQRGVDGAPSDAIDTILSQLPSDTLGYDQTEALNRILKTIPFAKIEDLPFPGLVATFERLLGL